VLTVTDGNPAATRLYESVGFRSFGIEPDAIRVEGHSYAKNHMHLDLGHAP
jgi:RimJ/RimL family protein N-acetyltransferase